jgi:hypothetical protein
MRDVKWRYATSFTLINGFSYEYGRAFIGTEEWSTEMPWLECRKKRVGLVGGEVADGAGCACYQCWPKEIRSDTRVSRPFFLGPFDSRGERLMAYSHMIGLGIAG